MSVKTRSSMSKKERQRRKEARPVDRPHYPIRQRVSDAEIAEELEEYFSESARIGDTFRRSRRRYPIPYEPKTPASQYRDPRTEEEKKKFVDGMTLNEVTRTYRRFVDGIFITVFEHSKTGQRDEIGVTGGHPFEVIGKGWVPISEMEIGNACPTKDGEAAILISRYYKPGRIEVFNFEVENSHTYFVSELGILVHNKCGPDGPEGEAPESLGEYTQLFNNAIANERKVFNDRLEVIKQLGISSTYCSANGVQSDLERMQEMIDKDPILRDYAKRIRELERIKEMAKPLSGEDQELFFKTIVTLYRTKVNGVRFEGNCHEWAIEAENQLSDVRLVAKRGFELRRPDAYQVTPGSSRPYKTWGWKDHSFIEITILETKERIYFDNGGLGMQMNGGITNSYGGHFWEMPSWLVPQR